MVLLHSIVCYISKYCLRDYVTIAMVIISVTMATPISSHVKDKNGTFTACDEDMIFLVKGEIEDITCPRVDMNFIFSWSTRYLTSERSERVRYRVDHEKIKFISLSGHVIFCLLYKHQ